MQVEWMRSSDKAAWKVDLNRLVPFQGVHRSIGKELIRGRPVQNLEQYRDCRWLKDNTVDGETESFLIETELEVEGLIGTAGVVLPWDRRAIDRA